MKRYGIGAFLAYGGLLCLAYYGSYRLSYGHMQKQQNELEYAGEAVLADSGQEALVKSDTEYVVENYNEKTGKTEEVRTQLPSALIGMDREEAQDYADSYTEDPDISDLERGFSSMELESFSEQRIVFRKTYVPWEKDYKYVLGEVDGHVVVYYLDKKTIYEYTDIVCVTLPKELREKISRTDCYMEIADLYAFLENFTS